MKSFSCKVGYKDSFINGDKKAPVLEDEMALFLKTESVNPDFVNSSSRGLTFSSCLTLHGKQELKRLFIDRIFNDDRHMTMLWYHPHEYSLRSSDQPPKYQRDKKSPPIQGQKGGWLEDKETGELERIPDIHKWVSYGRKLDSSGKKVRLEDGELLSLATSYFSMISNSEGCFIVPPHYEPKNDESNDYPGNVKFAILSSPLDDKDKQELLDIMYTRNDPIRDLDGYFCKKVKAFLYDNIGDRDMIIHEINLHSELPIDIRDNLLINMGVMKDSDANYNRYR